MALLKIELEPALVLAGSVLIAVESFSAVVGWGDFWMHDCYAISGSSLRVVSVMATSVCFDGCAGFRPTYCGFEGFEWRHAQKICCLEHLAGNYRVNWLVRLLPHPADRSAS